MSGREHGADNALLINDEKTCKKCNKKVTSAFTKCVKCADYYCHKSCFQILLNRKKLIEITENKMICEQHTAELSKEDKLYLDILEE